MAKKIEKIDESITVEKESSTSDNQKKNKLSPEKVIGKFTNEERNALKENYPVSSKSFKEKSGVCKVCGTATNLPERILCYDCYKKYKSLI